MSKLTFKRIALVLVTALSFGALSSVNASASTDETITLTASASTVELNESITVTVDVTGVAASASESLNVTVRKVGGAAFTATTLIPLTTDSSNVGGLGTLDAASATAFGYTEINAATTADQFTATTTGAYFRAKWTLRLSKASTAGTAIYSVSLRSGIRDASDAEVVEKVATVSVTVNPEDTTGTAGKSLVYLNKDTTPSNTPIRGNGLGYFSSDSSLTVNAGVADDPKTVGYMFVEPRNASDTRTASNGSAVTASVTLNVSGPGLLSISASGTKAKSVIATRTDTVVVWSDGTSGTMTVTGYVGGVALTQAAKTMTFVGIADTFIATLETSTIITGSNAAGAISFIAKDAAGNAINGTNTQYRTGGYPSGFFLVGADTTVVGKGATAVDRGAGSTAWYTQCSTYNTVASRWECTVPVTDSGTATVYIADSYTVGTALKKSQAITITVSGPVYRSTVSFDKTAYTVGEAALLTVTAKDYGSRNVIDQTGLAAFTGMYWVGSKPTFTVDSSSRAAGGNFTDLLEYLKGSAAGTTGGTVNSFVNGVDTAMVYMPTLGGTYSLYGITAGATAATEILKFTVSDPVQDAQ
ncbi:MAG: hypothetical protein EBU84_16615, partial [Actinobacteria bacterium]|nr:hypothetical protein [Actinomycetota bacterium]